MITTLAHHDARRTGRYDGPKGQPRTLWQAA